LVQEALRIGVGRLWAVGSHLPNFARYEANARYHCKRCGWQACYTGLDNTASKPHGSRKLGSHSSNTVLFLTDNGSEFDARI
jgi:hypothetical protein